MSSPSFVRRAATYAALLLFFVGVAWVSTIRFFVDPVVRDKMAVDFRSFYAAAVAARRGLDPGDFDVIRRIASELHFSKNALVFPYLYPPFFAYAFSWLGDMSHDTALVVWSYISIVLYAIASILIFSVVMNSEGRLRTSLLVLGAVMPLLLGLRANIGLGQVNTIVLVFICAAIWLSMTGRYLAAGFVLAFAVAIKITPIILAVPWLLERRTRAWLGLGAGLVAVIIGSVVLGAASAWFAFIARLPSMSHGSKIPVLSDSNVISNISLAGIYSRLIDSPGVVRVASIVSILVLLAILVVVAGRARSTYEQWLLPLTVVMIVASPVAYHHHIIYLMPAVLLATYRAIREERLVLTAVVLSLTAIAGIDFPALFDLAQFSPGPIASSPNLYALLMLYAIGLWRLRSRI
jgi:alpha-1,2-mannosyltransferase